VNDEEVGDTESEWSDRVDKGRLGEVGDASRVIGKEIVGLGCFNEDRDKDGRNTCPCIELGGEERPFNLLC
jgi:hypothetical protein